MDPALTFRESEERFRGCFEAASIGFALVDLNGRMRAANASMCKMLGYDEAELLGLTYPEFTHPDDHAAADALRQRVLAGDESRNHLEKRYYHKDGHVVWGLLAVSLVRTASGYPDYFVGQVTDITRQKMAEEALAQHAGELERSNTALQEFASLASHDLQEPLRVISAYVQLVTQHFGGILDEDGRRWLTYIVSGATRMHRLINDILALARVQAAGTPFTAVDVAQTVAAEWAELESMHPRLDATLTIETLPTVQADRAQMKVLFRNLLTNAFKYRRAAIPLTIHVSGARTAAVYGSESVWQFAVADNGIGLDMAHACDVFESFHRLHRDDEYEGTGIGLAICRRIVERHGGRIWVESAPDQGATFRFTLGEQAPHWR